MMFLTRWLMEIGIANTTTVLSLSCSPLISDDNSYSSLSNEDSGSELAEISSSRKVESVDTTSDYVVKIDKTPSSGKQLSRAMPQKAERRLRVPECLLC